MHSGKNIHSFLNVQPGLNTEHTNAIFPSGNESLIGQNLEGRFNIKGLVGEGGTSIVYKADQPLMGRTVAIKVIRGDIDQDAVHRRLKREILATANLVHPSIVRISSSGMLPDGRAYLVMDFVEGQVLAEIVEPGGISAKRAVALFIKICEALEIAHAQGVIHRDLKPSNIMVRTVENSEEIVILDFGLAKIVQEGNPAAQTLTGTTGIPGSPSYMSPEMCEQQAVDERSDIYSLGCLMYEMLTGAPPFTGDSALDLMYKHAHESPPPFNSKSTPKSLAKAVLRCLEKNLQTGSQLCPTSGVN